MTMRRAALPCLCCISRRTRLAHLRHRTSAHSGTGFHTMCRLVCRWRAWRVAVVLCMYMHSCQTWLRALECGVVPEVGHQCVISTGFHALKNVNRTTVSAECPTGKPSQCMPSDLELLAHFKCGAIPHVGLRSTCRTGDAHALCTSGCCWASQSSFDACIV